jgi:hypothetical protein
MLHAKAHFKIVAQTPWRAIGLHPGQRVDDPIGVSPHLLSVGYRGDVLDLLRNLRYSSLHLQTYTSNNNGSAAQNHSSTNMKTKIPKSRPYILVRHDFLLSVTRSLSFSLGCEALLQRGNPLPSIEDFDQNDETDKHLKRPTRLSLDFSTISETMAIVANALTTVTENLLVNVC